jgi:hypothetical protein
MEFEGSLPYHKSAPLNPNLNQTNPRSLVNDYILENFDEF